MRRDSIARSTPFRLALGFGAMFFAAFLVTGVTAFSIMRWQMYQRHDERISETYSSIAGTYRDDSMIFLMPYAATLPRPTGTTSSFS